MIEIINMIWLYACLAPALLGLALILIKIGRNSHFNLSESHKHNYDIIDTKQTLLWKTEKIAKYEVEDVWKCNDCDNTKTTKLELQYANKK